MEISIKDRLLLMVILDKLFPKINIVDGILLNSIRNKSELSSDDINNYNIIEDGEGNVSWSTNKVYDFKVTFNEREIELLKKGIEGSDIELSEGMIPDFFDDIIF